VLVVVAVVDVVELEMPVEKLVLVEDTVETLVPVYW
jgi:hypothetical protein